jgi:FkbM family methyltransferase
VVTAVLPEVACKGRAAVERNGVSQDTGMSLRKFFTLLAPPIAVLIVNRVAAAIGAVQPTVRIKYGDFFLECHSSHHLPRILSALPDFGRPLAEVVLALKVHRARVIDVGANIGDTALLLARFVPGTEVLCIEGDPQFMPYLKTNTSQITGVTIAQAILGDRSARVRAKFASSSSHGGTGHLSFDPDADLIEMHQLDDLLAEYPDFASPDVIKIDTDGYDAAILRGCARLLKDAKPVAFYEWDPYSYDIAGENDFGHAEFLMNLGYEHFLIFTNRGQPLLRVQTPRREVWESLAAFSRSRHSVDGWHYDVAAFPTDRYEVCERLWRRYAEPQTGPATRERSAHDVDASKAHTPDSSTSPGS